MKGSFKKTQDHFKNRTNFNDWRDPNCGFLYGLQKHPTSQAKHSQFETTQVQRESILSQTSNEIEAIRSKVRSGHPLLSLKEFRNLKLPLYEALLLNLQDDGYTGTYQFIKDIIELDDEWHKTKQEDRAVPVRKRSQLKLNEQALSLLSSGLTTAEEAHKVGNTVGEMSSLLQLALDFTKMDGLWHWLSEELYEQCIHITDSIVSPTEANRELEAIAKYLFAEFQLDILHEPNRAKSLLGDSMKLSEGKLYNASMITEEMKGILYLDSCTLLHRICLSMADENRSIDNENAIQLYKHSLHWARLVNNKVAETTALLRLIDIYIDAKQTEPVPGLLEDYLKLCTEQTNILGLCEGYILSAKYHNFKEDHVLEIEDLQTLVQIANENNLEDIFALAHYKLALLFLFENKSNAHFHATEAYKCYIKLKRRSEIETVSTLAGICQGQAILPEYIHLLLQVDKSNNIKFKTLIQWQTLHIQFFHNIKLVQPESVQNFYLQNKMENLKNEELTNQSTDDDYTYSLSTQISNRTLNSYKSHFLN